MQFEIDLYQYFSLSKTVENGILHAYFHEDNTPRTSVLVIPGGAYEGLCFRENKPFAERLYKEGFNAFYLDYTCGEQASYPTPLQEGGMAVVFIREWLEKKNGLQKLLIMGFSAGGHLVGHISNCKEEKYGFSFLSDRQKELWKVDGTIYGYPVVSTQKELIHEGSFRNLLKDRFDELLDKVSLENMIDENSPPAFLFHCEDDSVVPVQNSLVLAESYRKNKVACEMHLFPHGGHGVALPTEECWLKTEMHMVNPKLLIWWDLFKIWETTI
jgi:acetyl esterase/lipase